METIGMIMIYVASIVLIAGFPWVLDICLAYRSRSKTRKLLENRAVTDKLDAAALQEFIKEISKAPPGITGLSRASIALTVIIVLGIAMVHILVKECPATNDSQIVNNVLSMLAGLLAAITGFYFGGKAAEKKEEEGSARQTSLPNFAPKPVIPGKTNQANTSQVPNG